MVYDSKSAGLHAEVDFAFEKASAEMIAYWADQALNKLVLPAIAGKANWDADLVTEGPGGGPLYHGVFTNDAWVDALSGLRGSLLQTVRTTFIQRDEEGFRQHGLPPAQVWVDLAGLEREEIEAGRVSAVVGRPLLGEAISPATQDRFVDWLRMASSSLEALYSYMTVDEASYISPFERKSGIRWADGLKQVRKSTRGAYWANVLSEKHLEKLGGASNTSWRARRLRGGSLSRHEADNRWRCCR